MNPVLAMFYVFLVYSIGDFIADKTKAFISMFLVSATIFTISFWNGVPRTLFVDSGLLPFAKITICMAMIHIGSSINFDQFLKEWKTVVLAFVSTVAICLGVFFIGKLFIDTYYALMSAPIMAGATISYLIMEPLAEITGRPELKIFGVLVLVTQSFIGIPMASFFCKKSGDRYMDAFRSGKIQAVKQTADAVKKPLIRLPEKMSEPNVIICKLALISYLCSVLSKVTGINWMILGLIAGVIFHAIGLVEENCLVKANGFTFVMASIFTMIFAGLTQTTPDMLISMIAPLSVVLVLGALLCVVASVLVGRLLHFGWRLSIGLASAAFFGFPGTFLIAQEVSNACGRNGDEVKVMWDYIMPKLIISGIVSVSVVSGLMGSFMIRWAM
ncbi:MAG: hypothetical protein LKE33_02135 [Acidaminococcus sp.]|jgi:hypothetical protein|nr:hypothetical protein [Acidaminococcus sp.]MCI2100788.1 hypothetical protein [Acidaminococcus sp.]MCI2115109.1 hypothetical protein [Acidaminococcus sp.]MCI2117185.1 hypothetical protein [Acidaminococcus sp.]